MNIEKLTNNFYNNIEHKNLNKIQNIFNSVGEVMPDTLSDILINILREHFFNPVTPATSLSKKNNIPLKDIQKTYKWMSKSPLLYKIFTSNYYPFNMMIRYSQNLIKDIIKDPAYFNKITNNEAVAPKRLEIHATYANCNLACKMCLWRVNNNLKYEQKELEQGVLSVKQWKDTLKKAKSLGTDTIIFSGGGEPQLREESHEIINYSRSLGQKVLIYTNGTKLYQLYKNNSPLYKEFLKSDWLRVSIHAATNKTYSKLVGLNENKNNIDIVKKGIKQLIQDRNRTSSKLKIGINMVIQSANYNEIEKYIDMARELSVDFINLRVDCVNITKTLSKSEERKIYNQLSVIRKNYQQKKYNNMFIDFSDELIAPMNNWQKNKFILQPTSICRVHQYRSAINPFGKVAVCDLKAEPHYSSDQFTMGRLTEKKYDQIIKTSSAKTFPGNKCAACMPGQISINSVYNKLIEDYKSGINPEQQFFYFNSK